MNKQKHLFFVFDGPDVSGKSSLIKVLVQKLKENNYQVFTTREPGQVLKNLDFRKLFFSEKRPQWDDPMLDALFFVADRKINLKQIEQWIKQKSSQKKVIICDRYFYSTFVYQGLLSGAPFSKIELLHQTMGAWKIPDLVCFFSNKNAVTLGEAKHGGNGSDRFEQMSIKKSQETYQYYQKTANHFIKTQNHPIFFVDISDPLETKLEIVFQKIQKYFEE